MNTKRTGDEIAQHTQTKQENTGITNPLKKSTQRKGNSGKMNKKTNQRLNTTALWNGYTICHLFTSLKTYIIQIPGAKKEITQDAYRIAPEAPLAHVFGRDEYCRSLHIPARYLGTPA